MCPLPAFIFCTRPQTVGLRQTPSLNDVQKSKIAPLAFLHAAGHLCDLGVFGAGSVAVTHVFQVSDLTAWCYQNLLKVADRRLFKSKSCNCLGVETEMMRTDVGDVAIMGGGGGTGTTGQDKARCCGVHLEPPTVLK